MHLLVLLSIFAPPLFAADPCAISVRKLRLDSRANGHSSEWLLPAAPLPAGLPFTPEYAGFLAWVRSRTPWSAREILRNQLAVFRRGVAGLSPRDPGRASLLRDIANEEKVLRGELGRIRPAGCLESLLFQEMLESGSLRTRPSELGAVVLRKGNELRVLGDFYYTEEGSSPGSSPKTRARLARLLADGWRRAVDVHSHPFAFGNSYGDIGGAVMPSPPDLAKYAAESPELAVVTNGIDSIELRPAEYRALAR